MTRSAIKHAEEELRTAMLAGDVDALDRLLDDALLFVAPNGDVAHKHDDLDNYRTRSQIITRHAPSDFMIELHGDDLGVVTVKVDLGGTFRGQPFEGIFRYTRTWRRSAGGAWRVIAGAVVAST